MVYPIQAVSTWEYLGRPRVDPGTPSWRTIFELPFTLASVQPHSASTPPAAQHTHLIRSSPLVSGSYQNTYWLFTLHAHIQSYQESSTRHPLLASPSYPISTSSRRKSTSVAALQSCCGLNFFLSLPVSFVSQHPGHFCITILPPKATPLCETECLPTTCSSQTKAQNKVNLARMRNVDTLHSVRLLHAEPRDPALVPPRQQSASADRTFAKLAASADVLVCWCCGAASVPPGGDCASVGASRARRERARARFSAGLVPMRVESTRRTKRAPRRHPHAQRIAHPHTTLRLFVFVLAAHVQGRIHCKLTLYDDPANVDVLAARKGTVVVYTRAPVDSEHASGVTGRTDQRGHGRRLRAAEERQLKLLSSSVAGSGPSTLQARSRRSSAVCKSLGFDGKGCKGHGDRKRCPHYGVPGAANSARRYL
ncbi:hypothetical protein C8J57DRAFT_1470686 [Mycena rebaudengoi]|nr:hypothetical protein C8J57DRAFT_1470686 [Mycena rebaudengoi]